MPPRSCLVRSHSAANWRSNPRPWHSQSFSLLTEGEVGQVVSELSKVRFVDGKSSRPSPILSGIDELVFDALHRNQQFQLFAHPKRIVPPTYTRYEPGMRYSADLGHAIAGVADQLRPDLVMTLFLSRPDSCDGGGLAIKSPLGEKEIKLDAGRAIVYPANMLHHVTPVTRGVRMTAVFWIQSTVPDSRLRPILQDLGKAVMDAEAADDAALASRLSRAYYNLLRHVSDL